MKKMKLQVEELRVETFATAEAETEAGTVRAYYTGETCAPDPASRCGPNKCFPDQDPSEVYGTCNC